MPTTHVKKATPAGGLFCAASMPPDPILGRAISNLEISQISNLKSQIDKDDGHPTDERLRWDHVDNFSNSVPNVAISCFRYSCQVSACQISTHIPAPTITQFSPGLTRKKSRNSSG